MIKIALNVMILVWVLTIPFIVLGIGFSGIEFFYPSTLVRELSRGNYHGFIFNILTICYVFVPPLLYFTLKFKKIF